MREPPLSLELFAAILNELSTSRAELQEVLARHGVDEATWEAAEAHFDAWLDEGKEGEEPTMSPALGELAAAVSRVQSEQDEAALPLEVFLSLLVVQQRGENLVAALEQRGIPLSRYLQAHRFWLSRMASDPELRARIGAATR